MRSLVFIVFITLVIVFSAFHSAWAGGFDWLFNKFKTVEDTSLSDTKIADGLKEALRVGIDNTVKATGKIDGFFGNEAIKILLPEQLKPLERALRVVGFESQVDEFILSMNRAAEKAAPFAQDIFIDALFEMDFKDAKKILEGSKTEATDYFKDKTLSKLKEIFTPVVDRALADYQVSAKYKELMENYKKVPFSRNLPIPKVEDYVVDKALDGLFLVLGQQEQAIRENPAARVTEILQDVFK